MALPVAFLDMLGSSELLVIFLVVLVLFGGKKMPELARGLGKSLREFKKAAADVEQEIKRAMEEDEHRPSSRPTTYVPPSPNTILPPAASGESAGYDPDFPTETAGPTAAPATSPEPPATPATSAGATPSAPAAPAPASPSAPVTPAPASGTVPHRPDSDHSPHAG